MPGRGVGPGPVPAYPLIGCRAPTTLTPRCRLAELWAPPTCAEIPPIEIHHMETLSPETVTGAKGVGEGGTIGAPAAVVNAIIDAL